MFVKGCELNENLNETLEDDNRGKNLQKLVAKAHYVGSWDNRRFFSTVIEMTQVSPFAKPSCSDTNPFCSKVNRGETGNPCILTVKTNE